jgi:hypothetical protein
MGEHLAIEQAAQVEGERPHVEDERDLLDRVESLDQAHLGAEWAQRVAGRVRRRLFDVAATALGQAQRGRWAGNAPLSLDVQADRPRQLGDNPAGLLGVVDDLNLDVQDLEQPLGVIRAGLGKVTLDLRPQPLERVPVGRGQALEALQLEVGAGCSDDDPSLGHCRYDSIELPDPRPQVARGDRRGRNLVHDADRPRRMRDFFFGGAGGCSGSADA